MALSAVLRALSLLWLAAYASSASTGNKGLVCTVKPLGEGHDDTTQILDAIERCGHGGTTILEGDSFNITRKMTWDLQSSAVHLHGYLSFVPDIQYWLDANNTYRVIFIQDQASWFVVTGSDFVIDAHNEGGINGNGQPWWTYYSNRTRDDGDGRPVSLTVFNASNALVKDFRIEAQPFWCNAIAESRNVTYDGMLCNATNTDPAFFGTNIVPNTDGIDTYRSDSITMRNWDITCGDDCLAIKGNSTNIVAEHIACRGGNGIAFGSLGQYVNLTDIVENVTMSDLEFVRLNASVQPNMVSAVYFKTWDGTVNGVPPTGGGGAQGFVKNVTAQHIQADRVDRALHVYQTNGGHSGDAPSPMMFSDLHFADWQGTSTTNELIDIECSPAAPCPGISFRDFNITPPAGEGVRYICVDTVGNVTGLAAPCNATGEP